MLGLKCFSSPELAAMAYQCEPDQIRKVGILPVCNNGGTLEYLIAAPSAKKNPDEVLPFAIARGTRDGIDENGKRVDLKGKENDPLPPGVRLEPPADTALREAGEELGINLSRYGGKMQDAGTLNLPGKDYPLQLYIITVPANIPLVKKSDDSRQIIWASREKIDLMADDNRFNPSYLPILQAVDNKMMQISSLRTLK